ncbi:hypothetical protein Q3G72_020786 [Acer saccharum]|nr:hypothetical protein Q3G72_020786 [Acer saccharum]
MNGTQINCKDELVKEFGGSKEFINSASQALQGKTDCPTNLSNSLEAAYQVADCDYESNTNWGEKVGWLYGSKSEDVLTGINNPIFATLTGNLQFRQCLSYFRVFILGFRCIPDLCYAALPAYCIITNSNFLPKLIGLSKTVFEVSQKDHHESSSARDGNNNSKDDGFSFDESSMFIPGTTMVLMQLTALTAGSLEL